MPFRFNPFTDKLDLTETGGSGGGITTINGDSGSITGTTVTIFANNATVNSGSSVLFVNSGSTSTFNVTDASHNTIIGKSSGNLTLSGGSNTALGWGSSAALTSGASNTAIGTSSLTGCTTSADNTAIGAGSLFSLTTGVGFNSALGNTSLNALATGTYNLALGSYAGLNYTGSESSNILLSNRGTLGESNTIRIGTQGSGNQQQNQAFIAGVTGVTAVGSPVAVSSTGQLSDLGFGTATQVLTSNGAGVSPTWQAAGGGGATTYFQAYRTTNQTVAGGNTTTTIIFDTAISNVGSAYNTGTGIFTAPATGFYGFACTVNYINLNVPTGLTEILLAYTGSVQSVRLIDQGIGGAKSGTGIILTACWAMPMTSGDTVKIQPFCDGSGNYAIAGAAESSSAFNTPSTFSGWRIA